MKRTESLVKITTAVLLALVGAASVASQAIDEPRDPIDDDPRPDPITCSLLPDGVPCPNELDRTGDCTVPLCRAGNCVETPEPAGTPCRDTDGNPLTVSRCEAGTGRCDQRAETRPRFTSESPEDVVAAALDPVIQPTAVVDCGLCCESQNLEALRVPTAAEPLRQLGPGQSGQREMFCGAVVGYGVHDENADPRDILINIEPPEPPSRFDDFVRGFEQTQCSPPGRGCIHAEITPANQFYEEDDVFLPISSDEHCDDGGIGSDSCSSFLERDRSPICVYGPYAFDHGTHKKSSHRDLNTIKDDSHDHPEIHPIDAIWWPQPAGNGWVFAVFQDDSNRYSEPYCNGNGGFFGSNNANGWSQAPRDLRFSFPFSFPLSEAPVRANLRHIQTRNFDGQFRTVLPLNVTTKLYTQSDEGAASRRFTTGGNVLLEVVEEDGMDLETEVGIVATVDGDQVSGTVNLRLAVGCDPSDPQANGCSQAILRAASPRGRHDAGDPGSGYFYGELVFESAPLSAVTAVLRLFPAGDPGRFDIRVDGTTRASRVGNGGSTGRLVLAVGNHQVSLAPASGTDPASYRTTFSGACSGDGRIDLRLGDNATCTVTTRRRLAPGDVEECVEVCAESLELCKADPATLPSACVAANNACEAACRN
ncbi:MAG: hypothetical protein WBO54_03100 [Thermoanaerobaculia bacterium]